jgi:hypothetical protein
MDPDKRRISLDEQRLKLLESNPWFRKNSVTTSPILSARTRKNSGFWEILDHGLSFPGHGSAAGHGNDGGVPPSPILIAVDPCCPPPRVENTGRRRHLRKTTPQSPRDVVSPASRVADARHTHRQNRCKKW